VPKHFLEDSPAEKGLKNTASPKRKAPLKQDSFIEEKKQINFAQLMGNIRNHIVTIQNL